jgi:hypothetical protein
LNHFDSNACIIGVVLIVDNFAKITGWRYYTAASLPSRQDSENYQRMSFFGKRARI